MDLQGRMQALMKHVICRIPDQNQMEKNRSNSWIEGYGEQPFLGCVTSHSAK